jgi:hypothetical protein
MGLYEGRGQLSKAMKDLNNRWLDTKASWDDVVARRFEEKYLRPLEADLKVAAAAMDHMAILLSQIQRDCT